MGYLQLLKENIHELTLLLSLTDTGLLIIIYHHYHPATFQVEVYIMSTANKISRCGLQMYRAFGGEFQGVRPLYAPTFWPVHTRVRTGQTGSTDTHSNLYRWLLPYNARAFDPTVYQFIHLAPTKISLQQPVNSTPGWPL